jgi:FKBP-type peptidyl-prolyl cis-trans isomerase
MARFAFLIISAAFVIGCNSTPSGSAKGTTPDGKTSLDATPVAKLKMTDVEPGKGDAAKVGDTIMVLYRGTLMDGKEFDGNMSEKLVPSAEKPPFSLTLGAGMVIKGWEDGLVGTKEGMVRNLEIPYKMAYGEEGNERIPPKSDLKFTVKVLKVFKQGVAPEIEVTDVKMGSGAVISANSTVVMSYKGTLLNGKVFDERTKEKMKISQFFESLQEALLGMKEGGVRKVVLPPHSIPSAYSIPQDQIAEFEFTLIDVL